MRAVSTSKLLILSSLALLQFAVSATADVNGACTDELVIGRNGGSDERWFVHSDEAGGFGVLNGGGSGWGVARRTTAVAVGDVDGDGLDEFAIGRDGAASQSPRFFVFNDASEGFSQMFSSGDGWGAARRVTAMAFGNVDDDPRLELAVGRTGPSGFRFVILDDSAADFTQLSSGGNWGSDRSVTSMAFGDVDGDGRDELVIGRTGGVVQRSRWIVLDDATENFQELLAAGDNWGAQRDVSAVATGDVDGDGRAEIAIGRSAGSGFRWQVLDDATEGFTELANGGAGAAPWGITRSASALAMGDVDGDGVDELIVGRNAGGGPRILVFDDASQDFRVLNTMGNGWGVTRGTTALAAGDVDGDSVDEIAAGRNGGANERWFVYDDLFRNFAIVGDGGNWPVTRSVEALALRSARRTGLDQDEDGLFDSWENAGIDVNCDGLTDFQPSGADPLRKNVYVELDFMQNHSPDPDAVNDVITAFANGSATNPDGSFGIDLTIDQDEQIPEQLDITTWGDFDDIRAANFGTAAERADPNGAAIVRAKALFYRYALMAHKRDGDTSSGRAKRGNFVVSLGGSPFGTDSSGHNVGSRVEQAGTIMHELGHTLGLRHGGGDGTNCKPNYLSVMNYTFQVRLIPNPAPTGPRLDYSRQDLDDLDENSLDETLGIQDGMDSTLFSTDGTRLIQVPGIGAVDWNRVGGIDPVFVGSDINFLPITECPASPGETLGGFDDWQNLFLPTRSAPGAPNDTDTFPDDELTGEDAAILGACAEGEDTARCTTPPFEYAAKFVCGLQSDPRTLRLARGVYGTTVNVHNSRDEAVFYKKVALSYPPEEQKAGEIRQMGKDLLRYDEALKVDCEDIRENAFNGEFPEPYIEGFVVIQSFESLDVTAVYTTAALNQNAEVSDHSSIDVEQVPERGRISDLTVTKSVSTFPLFEPTDNATIYLARFMIGVSNIGPESAHNVVLHDELSIDTANALAAAAIVTDPITLPPGAEVTDSTFVGPTLSTLDVDLGTLEPGTTVNVAFWAFVATNVPAGTDPHVVLKDAASVQSYPADVSGANNATSVEAVLIP